MKLIQNCSAGKVIIANGVYTIPVGGSINVKDSVMEEQEFQSALEAGWIKVVGSEEELTSEVAPEITIEKNEMEGSPTFPGKEAVEEPKAKAKKQKATEPETDQTA